MSGRIPMKTAAQVVLIACAVIAAHASGSGFAGTCVCVVAVRDSGLFTMCPSGTLIKAWRYPSRTPSQEIIQNPEGPRLGVPQHIIQLDRPVLDRSRAGWWDIVGKLPGYCPSGRIDFDLRKGIEKEIAKQNDYALVDSPEKAGLIFLAEGLYADQSSGFIGAQTARYRSSGIPLLAAVMAVVVPAGAYLQNPSDSELLLDAKIWEGTEAWKSAPPEVDRQPASVAASLEQLVGRFVNRENLPGEFPPLCAPRILSPAVDSLGRPQTKAKPQSKESGAPVSAGNPAAAPTPDHVIRLDVSLVTVPTMVSDASGKRVEDLNAKDFHVFENGIEQQIDRVIPEITPFNVVLMLDTSGSTIFKHSEIQNAALAFVEALRPEERVMVVSFDSYIYLDSPLTGDRAALRRAILHTDMGAGTRLYDAMDIVLTECLGGIEGRKAIVLFTDGIDSQSWLARFNNNRSKVEESDAVVYAVQFDSLVASPASEYLKGLTDPSGGRLFLASTTTNLAGAFAEITDELRHQYTLCYYPASHVNDGAFQQIRVTVDRPGVLTRARTGYRVTRRQGERVP
jgi:Ca-activated chloride channel family protein